MNRLGGTGLWDEDDGFYYDKLRMDDRTVTLRVRSLVGLIPLLAAEVIQVDEAAPFEAFRKRAKWFVENSRDLMEQISGLDKSADGKRLLLALASKKRLERILPRLFDETEFLSRHGVRSLSRHHDAHPFEVELAGERHSLRYEPGEGMSGLFGGNSNWRGPVWFPITHLLVEALERYHHFYGPSFTVELPTGSGRRVDLATAAAEIDRRLTSLFLRGSDGRRPCVADHRLHGTDPHWRDLMPFHEYFHADNGRGMGASHQTGWTALVVRSIENLAHRRADPSPDGSGHGTAP
jgi:hypothetical protein